MPELTDDDEFNQAGLRCTEAIADALAAISDDNDPEHWHAALAVYVGRAIRRARHEQKMPDKTAAMLVDCIREFALGDEIRADA